MKNGLQLRIILGTIAVLLFITVLVAGVAVCTARIFLEESARRDAEQRHAGITQMIEMYARRAQAQANSLARHSLVVEAVENRNARDLFDIATPIMQAGELDYLVFTDAQGFVIAPTHAQGKAGDPAESIAGQAHIGQALQGKSFAGLEEGRDIKLLMCAGAPLYDRAGVLIGAVSTGYVLSKDAIVDKAKEMLGAEFTLFVGSEGVATTLTGTEGKPMRGAVLDNPAIEQTVLQEGRTYHGFHSVDQVRYTAFYAPLTGANGKVIGMVYTGISTAAMEQLLAGLSGRVAVVALAVGLLMFMVILIFTRPLIRSLRMILKKVREVAAGDMGTFPLEIRGRDEIGQLAGAVNTLLANLRDLIIQTASPAEQVAVSSRQLTDIAGQMALAAGQIAASTTQVEQESTIQAQSVDSVSRVVEQMSGSIEELMQKAEGVAAASGEAAAAVCEGGKAIDPVAGQMSVIARRVAHSAQVVMGLGERSREIGQMINRIAGIAGQANSLALSTALEAARLGEQGRGFVTAAGEAAELAEQTQEAVGQIAALLEDMQDETRQAAGDMKDETQEIRAGINDLCEVGLSVDRTVDLAREVSEQVRAICAVLLRMDTERLQIISTMQQIEKSSIGTANQAWMLSATTGEQSASIGEITVFSQTLAKIAEELHSNLRKFNI